MLPKIDSCQSQNDFMSAKCISCCQNFFMSPKIFFMSPKTEFHVAKLMSCPRGRPLFGCFSLLLFLLFMEHDSGHTVPRILSSNDPVLYSGKRDKHDFEGKILPTIVFLSFFPRFEIFETIFRIFPQFQTIFLSHTSKTNLSTRLVDLNSD